MVQEGEAYLGQVDCCWVTVVSQPWAGQQLLTGKQSLFSRQKLWFWARRCLVDLFPHVKSVNLPGFFSLMGKLRHPDGKWFGQPPWPAGLTVLAVPHPGLPCVFLQVCFERGLPRCRGMAAPAVGCSDKT